MRFDVAASAPSAAASYFRGSCCDLDRAQDDALANVGVSVGARVGFDRPREHRVEVHHVGGAGRHRSQQLGRLTQPHLMRDAISMQSACLHSSAASPSRTSMRSFKSRSMSSSPVQTGRPEETDHSSGLASSAITRPVGPTAAAATSASCSWPAVQSTNTSPSRNAHADVRLSEHPLRTFFTRNTPKPPCRRKSCFASRIRRCVPLPSTTTTAMASCCVIRLVSVAGLDDVW